MEAFLLVTSGESARPRAPVGSLGAGTLLPSRMLRHIGISSGDAAKHPRREPRRCTIMTQPHPMSRPPKSRFVLTHFMTVADVAPSAQFQVDILGGRILPSSEPTMLQVAKGCVTLNKGGGPTVDRPTLTLHTPEKPKRRRAS